MAGLTGLTGLTSTTNDDPEGSAEVTYGGPSEVHAQNHPGIYPWQDLPGDPPHGPYGTQAQLIEGVPGSQPAGAPGPLTNIRPTTHAAPWPKGIGSGDNSCIQEAAEDAWCSAERHTSDQNEVNPRLTGRIAPPNVAQMTFNYNSRGQSGLATDVPPQLKGARGKDMAQGFQKPMDYDFAGAHVSERFPMPGVPGNYLWQRPGARPLIIETPNAGNPAWGTGQDSVFAGQTPQVTYGPTGAVLQNPPNQYQNSPEPTVNPALNPQSAGWGWSEW